MEFHIGKFVCSTAAYCSGLSDMYAGKNIKLQQDVNLLGLCRRFPRLRDSLQRNCIIATEKAFNINCTRQVAAHLLRKLDSPPHGTERPS